ncbi:uncharacterized protein [Centruroides vittatus]|uniref:uncharacterized protein n=1 Tax=Centruroides vittatus TaxID=120091 RepID=UPI00350F9663
MDRSSARWEEDADSCDCPDPPPPPQFALPPPPAPASLEECKTGYEYELHNCRMEPVREIYTPPSFPLLPILTVCSSVIVVALLVATYIFWRHKKKVQNFLPTKTETSGRCELPNPNGVTYDDMIINHHPIRLPPQPGIDTSNLPPCQVLHVKYDRYGTTHLRQAFPFPQNGVSELPPSLNYDNVSNETRQLYSPTTREPTCSEEEFAEDELSLQDQSESQSMSRTSSTDGDLSREATASCSSDDGRNKRKKKRKTFSRRGSEGMAETTLPRTGRSSKRNSLGSNAIYQELDGPYAASFYEAIPDALRHLSSQVGNYNDGSYHDPYVYQQPEVSAGGSHRDLHLYARPDDEALYGYPSYLSDSLRYPRIYVPQSSNSYRTRYGFTHNPPRMGTTERPCGSPYRFRTFTAPTNAARNLENREEDRSNLVNLSSFRANVEPSSTENVYATIQDPMGCGDQVVVHRSASSPGDQEKTVPNNSEISKHDLSGPVLL